MKKQTYIVEQHEQGQLLREFIFEKGISNKALKRIKAHGKIECNNQEVSVRYQVKEKDIICLTFAKESSNMPRSDLPLTVCYEDDDYLIIDKPKNIPCIPNKRYPNATLANAILNYYHTKEINATVHLVNRLDKETSGLMVIAKHSYAHYALSKDIKQVKRIYHCLVEGELEGEGWIEAPILKKLNSIKRCVDSQGKYALTKYKVIEKKAPFTLVECQLETGRTHQIRVHMAHIAHPLVSDPLYGQVYDADFYLESIYVSFIHPFTGKFIEIKK
jgi:23S rRNA pseudouridine1911/1915/1917 synthase